MTAATSTPEDRMDDVLKRLWARHAAWQRETKSTDESVFSWAAEEITRLRAALSSARAAPGATAGRDAVIERKAIEYLVVLARLTLDAANNSEDCGNHHKIEREYFSKVDEALDALDDLPDDQPGYTMTGPAKAEWALRALLAAPPSAEAQPEARGDREQEVRHRLHLSNRLRIVAERNNLHPLEADELKQAAAELEAIAPTTQPAQAAAVREAAEVAAEIVAAEREYAAGDRRHKDHLFEVYKEQAIVGGGLLARAYLALTSPTR
jgi:hypothetical protein